MSEGQKIWCFGLARKGQSPTQIANVLGLGYRDIEDLLNARPVARVQVPEHFTPKVIANGIEAFAARLLERAPT